MRLAFRRPFSNPAEKDRGACLRREGREGAFAFAQSFQRAAEKMGEWVVCLERLAIAPGFRMETTPDGRAISRGLPEDNVVDEVERWQASNPLHHQRSIAKEWLALKRQSNREGRAHPFRVAAG